MNSDEPDTRTARGVPAWLLCLLLVTFVVGTDDFVVAGVLPEIASGLSVSEAAAGQLVSVFSITYALAAPVMAVVTSRLDRRTLLIGGMAVFALVNVGAALAPSYPVLMVFRILAALTAASVTPAAFATAGRLAAPERIGRAIGTVAAGLTVALILGVPMGTWLGANFGWRSTFVSVVGLAVVLVAALPVFLPALPGAAQLGLARRVRLLGRAPVLLGLVGTVFGATGGLMTYTYIAPITRDLSGAGAERLAVLIAAVGVAGAVGTVLGGRATDRWGPDRALLLTLAGQVAATAGLATIGLVGDAGTEAVALNTSGLYLGIAAGGALGGAALAGYGGTGVVLTASAIGLVTLALLASSVTRYRANRTAIEATSLADVGHDPARRHP